MHAYILVSLNKAEERKIAQRLSKILDVKEVGIVFGEWDLIVKLDMENPQEVAEFVIERIRDDPDVNLTSTLIVAQEF